jgi:hypothetical protein
MVDTEDNIKLNQERLVKIFHHFWIVYKLNVEVILYYYNLQHLELLLLYVSQEVHTSVSVARFLN